MSEPQWIEENVVIDIHDAQLAEHGGLGGVRDRGLLQSALQAPVNAWHYVEPVPDLCALAALYGVRLAKNHPFSDGNKRTAAVITELFLRVNRLSITASDEEMYPIIMGIADGSMGEKDFAEWLRLHTSSI